jgi:Protein of unknown function, DUF481
MRLTRLTLTAILLGAAGFGQNAPKPEPDVLIFTDGEKLIGHLKSSHGSSVTFTSDMAGDITVEWSKIKELHSAQKFAVIKKDMKIHRHLDTSTIPQGTVAVADQKIEIAPGQGPVLTVPVADAAHVLTAATFEGDLKAAGFLEDWKGAITGGIALVESTQKSQNFNGGFHFVRATPSADWLEPRNRTIVDFSAAYGKITQPNTPEIKTEIYHAGLERDEYISPRFFAFGQALLDHNFSQGLDLQQNYGGGFGLAAIKSANQEVDLKGSITYTRQSFAGSTGSKDLIGATLAESYNRKFKHGILFAQNLSITPAFNNSNAYSAIGNATLTAPFYKRLNLSVGTVDTFLNDPPPGFKKNSFQFTTGVTYTLP